jgi:adenosylmethionine-8-amino-7-oxononanoate aminotransferase
MEILTLVERDQKVIWHPYTQMKTAEAPLGITKGSGLYLYDVDGKKYMDMISSWWVTLHGHSHPYIAKKVSEQLGILEQVIFAGCTHEPAVRLAERLLEILPGSPSRIFYSDNGSTAVEVALKMVFQYWRNTDAPKSKIIAFKGSYHGDTFGAMSVSGRSIFTKAFSEFLFDVVYIDVPLAGNEKEVLEQMELALLEYDIAAFIYEPVIQGSGGMKIYSKDTLNALIQLCKEKKVITIADEVMTGFYRTGKFFASEYMDEKPDIYCLSKGLTGGTMAMGVTACSQNIYDAFLSDNPVKTLFHGHSFTANPLTCMAALASLDLLEKPELPAHIQILTEAHQSFVSKLGALTCLQDARCLGTIMVLEFKTTEEAGYLNTIRNKTYAYFIERGILIRPLGHVLYIMPPYCITIEELESVYKVITNYLDILEAAE